MYPHSPSLIYSQVTAVIPCSSPAYFLQGWHNFMWCSCSTGVNPHRNSYIGINIWFLNVPWYISVVPDTFWTLGSPAQTTGDCTDVSAVKPHGINTFLWKTLHVFIIESSRWRQVLKLPGNLGMDTDYDLEQVRKKNKNKLCCELQEQKGVSQNRGIISMWWRSFCFPPTYKNCVPKLTGQRALSVSLAHLPFQSRTWLGTKSSNLFQVLWQPQ